MRNPVNERLAWYRSRQALGVSVLLSLLNLFPELASARETVLVEAGEARATIVLPASAPAFTPRGGRTMDAAASDLAYHIEAMSGARLEIVDDPTRVKGVPIYIGVVPDGFRLPVDLRDESIFWPDGYLIVADGEQVILTAPRPEGVSNSVYGLLEDHLGCHWFTPGRIGEHIPQRPSVTLNVEGGYEIVKPDREIAQPWYSRPRPLGRDVGQTSPPEEPDLGEWMRRNRYGGVRGYWGHYWSVIYARDLLEREPDLAPFYGGRRRPEVHAGHGQVCLAHPRAVEVAVEYFDRFFTDHPEWDLYSFSANDGGGWCTCAECNALAPTHAGRLLRVAKPRARSTRERPSHQAAGVPDLQSNARPAGGEDSSAPPSDRRRLHGRYGWACLDGTDQAHDRRPSRWILLSAEG